MISSPLTLSFDLGNATAMEAMWPIITNTMALKVSQSWAGHPVSRSARSLVLRGLSRVKRKEIYL